MFQLRNNLKSNIKSSLKCIRSYSSPANLDEAIRDAFSQQNKEKMLNHIKSLKQEDNTAAHYLLKSLKKKAAVLVPLCKVNGQPSLLLTVRTNHLPTHKGQVSFPGGGVDSKRDKSVVDAALRETEEEIGFSRDKVDIWGSLSPIPDQFLISAVYPIIGYLGNVNLKDLTPCESEVSKVFTISLNDFFKPNFCKITEFRGLKTNTTRFNYTMPVYMSEPKVWGLTAIVIDQVLSVLLNGYYKQITVSSLVKRIEFLDKINAANKK